MSKTKCALLVLSILLLSNLALTDTINIPADQPTIQAGINVAVDGDTVLVQPGNYLENINIYSDDNNIVIASLFLTTQDTSYISQTIIDGDQNGSVVRFSHMENSNTMLIGFKLINGTGSDIQGEYYGGGIYCALSNPSLMYLNISQNTATSGAGINIVGSNPIIENLTITNNSATYAGGGVYFNDSSPNCENLIVSDNSATNYGGGFYINNDSNPNIENVVTSNNFSENGGGICCRSDSSPNFTNAIVNNNSSEQGGGIYCRSNSNPYFEKITLIDNSSIDGGGLYCHDANPILENVTIKNNSASDQGGGIFLRTGSSAHIINVTITDNSANFGGGVHCLIDCNPVLENVTIANNSATYGVGGMYCYDNSNPCLINTILWSNTPLEIEFSTVGDPNSITISYSDIQNGEAGIVTNNNGTVNWLEGNIDEDPLFVGTGENPYSLFEYSPCIDTGIPDTTGLNLPAWDIIGNLRIWDGDENGSAIIDMGAYEYGAPPYVDVEDNVIVQTPEVFLHQNYPNPFNPSTTIEFSIQKDSNIELSIYNIKGQKVRTLADNDFAQGSHSIIWNGDDEYNKPVGSGIYYYKLNVNGKTEAVRKCLLLK